MDAPQLRKQTIPAQPLRLADLKIQAGPREIEFEIELPKGSQWDLAGVNTITLTSSAPEVAAPGQSRFNESAMAFYVPVTALRTGEAILTYDVRLAWTEQGEQVTDQRQLVQRVFVEAGRGATVPWVHYKALGNGGSSATAGEK
jgi:hypothetical protein